MENLGFPSAKTHHHGTSPFRRGELGRDDGRERIIPTDANAHEYAPKDDEPNDGHGWRVGAQSLGESGEDDDDQLESVHPLPTDDVGESTEADLANDCSSRSSDLLTVSFFVIPPKLLPTRPG